MTITASEAHLLVFSATAGFRHGDAIDAGLEFLEDQARRDGITMVATEDPALFTPEHLARASAVVWLNTSGTLLNEGQRVAFEDYLATGGGFAGIHGATDTEYDWPEFGRIVGARFAGHPRDSAQRARVRVVDEQHPSTALLPNPWMWTDEWYSFREVTAQHVLLEVDETSYDPDGTSMSGHHPVSWCGRYGAGATWYTALGHHEQAYRDVTLQAHIWNGIRSVLRAPATM